MHLNPHTPQSVQRESSQPNQDPSTIAAEPRSLCGTSEQPGSANGQSDATRHLEPLAQLPRSRACDRVSAEIPAPPRVVIAELIGAVLSERAPNATIAFRRSDRETASGLDDPYGDIAGSA